MEGQPSVTSIIQLLFAKGVNINAQNEVTMNTSISTMLICITYRSDLHRSISPAWLNMLKL
jgi:hypothetical protein